MPFNMSYINNKRNELLNKIWQYVFYENHFSFFHLFFFFKSYGDHRDLHSFPTRRSSDLADATGIRTPLLFWLHSARREAELHRRLHRGPLPIPVATTSPEALTDAGQGNRLGPA